MTEFAQEIRNRIDETRRDVASAEALDDSYLVGVHVNELESLARLAVTHGLALDDEVMALLDRHGGHTPALGLGLPPVIDLDGSAARPVTR